jgi:uncharacterized membrane protein YkvA (DUF1232 family)
MALKFIDKFRSKDADVELSESTETGEKGYSIQDLQEKVMTYLAENAEKLKKWYSDAQLSEKLAKVAKKVGTTILYPVLLLYNLYKSPNTSTQTKMMIMAPLAYFILPVDIIPDALVGLGFTDDALAMMAALKRLSSSLTPEIFEQTREMHKNLIGELDNAIVKKIEDEIAQ